MIEPVPSVSPEQNSQFLVSFLLNDLGNYFYEISDKDKYINTDIKCGDIFYLEHKGQLIAFFFLIHAFIQS